jgi:hypothetical protein
MWGPQVMNKFIELFFQTEDSSLNLRRRIFHERQSLNNSNQLPLINNKIYLKE